MRNFIQIYLLILLCLQGSAQSADSSLYFSLKASEEKAGRLYMQAYQDYKRSLAFDAKNPDILRQFGLTEVELRKYEEAIPVFENLISLIPADTTAITQLARLYFYEQNWEKVIPYATRALQKHIGQKNYYMIGKSYYELEDYGHAFSFLPSAAAEEPKNAEIPYLIARSYVNMNNYKPAIPYFRKAIELDSGKAQWIYECALVYATIYDDESAIKYYELAAARGYKKDNDFYENLADSYVSAGRTDEALKLLNDLLLKKPTDPELLNSIGSVYYKLKKYDEAIVYWEQILEFDKQNARALYMIGMSYQKKGEKEKGKALCDRAIAIDPSLNGRYFK